MTGPFHVLLHRTATLARVAGAACLAVCFCGDSASARPGPVDDNYGYGRVAEAVDLGLSVKWADHNIGSSFANEVGRYFGYGDVDGRETSNDFKKYTKGDICGTEHDPAFVYWGGGWRLPTADEITELCERCEWRWVKLDGVEGFKVVGRRGKSIFLPVSGMKSNGNLQFEKIRGYYWSGNMCDDDANYAPALFFYKGGKLVKDYKKVFGFVIRPVRED